MQTSNNVLKLKKKRKLAYCLTRRKLHTKMDTKIYVFCLLVYALVVCALAVAAVYFFIGVFLEPSESLFFQIVRCISLIRKRWFCVSAANPKRKSCAVVNRTSNLRVMVVRSGTSNRFSNGRKTVALRFFFFLYFVYALMLLLFGSVLLGGSVAFSRHKCSDVLCTTAVSLCFLCSFRILKFTVMHCIRRHSQALERSTHRI